MSQTKGINDVVPERLSERTIEVNFIRRLVHCLEECRGVDRDDIVPLSPTQQEEAKKGYDTLVDGLCVALQFKRPCRMRNGCVKFEINSRQARRLKKIFPPGAAFYVLPLAVDLNELVKTLPIMLDRTYIVDVHKLFPNGMPRNSHSCTLWIDHCGHISVCDKGFQNGPNVICPPLSRPVSRQHRSYNHTLSALRANVLCDKQQSNCENIGFSLNVDGSIAYMAPGPKLGSIQWKTWKSTMRHSADEPTPESFDASVDILHTAKDAKLALVCMGVADKQGH